MYRLRSILNCSIIGQTFLKRTFVSVASTNLNADLKSWEQIPGPSSLPFIGPAHHFLPGGQLYTDRSDISMLLEKLYKTYGPLVRLDGLFGSQDKLFIFDPELSAHVLRSENLMPARPDLLAITYYREHYKSSEENPGKYISTMQGENWKKARCLVNPFLLKTNIPIIYNSIFDEIAQDTVCRIRSRRLENFTLQETLSQELKLWSMEATIAILLGIRVNCFDMPKDSLEERLFNVLQVASVMILNMNSKFLWKWIPTPGFYKCMSVLEEIDNLIDQFIQKYARQPYNVRKGEDGLGVLEKIMNIDKELARNVTKELLQGSLHLISDSVLHLLYLLAKNPEKQNKLRKELYTQSENSPYLKACYKESLRLIQINLGLPRQISKEYNLLGYRIPKDTCLIICNQHMSNMESEYPRANEFIPERWIETDSKLSSKNAHPFTYLPFGFGVRTCIARRYAVHQVETLLSRIVKNFEIGWVGPPAKFEMKPTNMLIKPYNIVFKDI